LTVQNLETIFEHTSISHPQTMAREIRVLE